METKVKFVACDMPEAKTFMLDVYAAVAEQEACVAPKYRAEALDRARQLEPVMREMQFKGYSMRRMASELNERAVQTARGGDWHPQTVKMVLQRLRLDLRRT